MNVWQAVGQIRNLKPNCNQDLALQLLNNQIQSVLGLRTWSDTVKVGAINIPDQYAVGTVSMTPGSNVATGSGTDWPVNDQLNGVLAADIDESPGVQEITPGVGVLQAIQPGSYLLLDQESPSATEVIQVLAVGPKTFTAYCQNVHPANTSLQMSSFAGRQFRVQAAPVFDILAVTSPTTLEISLPFGGKPQAGVRYAIIYCNVSVSPTAVRLLDAYDPTAGQPVGTDRDDKWLARVDPQRNDAGNQLEQLVPMPASPGGIMRWAVYPLQTSAYIVPVLYEDGWPMLAQENDTLPPFINPAVILEGCFADALMTRSLPRGDKVDPYYDPNAAVYWREKSDRKMEEAVQKDYGRRNTALQDWKQMAVGNSPSFNSFQNHAVEAPPVY